MTIGYFGRAFDFKHKGLTTKTHVVENNKVLCGYTPHKTLSFQWCSFSVYASIEMIECPRCKKIVVTMEQKAHKIWERKHCK